MTLPDFFTVDKSHMKTVTYLFKIDDQYACMEYRISMSGARGSWVGGFFENKGDIGAEWDYWASEDQIAIQKTLDDDWWEVAKEMLDKLIFAPK